MSTWYGFEEGDKIVLITRAERLNCAIIEIGSDGVCIKFAEQDGRLNQGFYPWTSIALIKLQPDAVGDE